MKIKSFKEWNKNDKSNCIISLYEMADNNNINYVPSREFEFIEQFNTSFMKLLKNGINSEHYNLYQYGSGTFYLTDENNKYLGFIDGYVDDKNRYFISMSSSEIKGNFYNLMFTSILGYTNIKEILSDDSLSPKAAKAYENLLNKSQLKVQLVQLVQLLSHNNYEDFDINKLFSDKKYRASVTESITSNIKESIKTSFTIPVIYKLYTKRDVLFNNRIYCESNVI